MRILHLDEQRGWRGGEQQASYLIRGLVQRGHDVYIAGRPGAPFLTRDHGAPLSGIVACPFANEGDLLTAWRLARYVRQNHIDILHAHTGHTHTMACLARTLARRGRVIVSRRVDFAPASNPFNRLKYAWPDRMVAISDRIAQVLRDSGLPEQRITVVHSAIDPARLDAPPLSKADLGVPEDALVIGNVAALVDHKDQTTLLHAMACVVHELPRAHLLIAGEGPLRPALTALRDTLGLNDRVHFLGYRNDVPGILRALDVFVMSSKEEGLGTSVLDAMACGIPVAATAGGGIPEMVRDGQTGLLVPVGDAPALAKAILRLANDRAFAATLTRDAHALVLENFTVDRMVEGNLAVYESALAANTA